MAKGPAHDQDPEGNRKPGEAARDEPVHTAAATLMARPVSAPRLSPSIVAAISRAVRATRAGPGRPAGRRGCRWPIASRSPIRLIPLWQLPP